MNGVLQLGRSKRAVALVLALVVALALLPGAAAAGPSNSDVVVGPDETVSGDLTATTGDVVVHGTVEGDVTAAAGSVAVTGEVDGSVSAAAGSVTVGGRVGGDASAAAGSVDIRSGATVGGDASAGAGSVTVAEGATVRGDVNAGAGTADVAGTVEGDVNGGERVVLASTATVRGDVTYHDSFDRAPGATVGGTVTHEPDTDLFGPTVELDGLDGLDGLDEVGLHLVPGVVPDGFHAAYWAAIALLVGAVLLLAFPEFSADLATRASDDPLRAGAVGFVALFGVPLVLVVCALTVVGIPVALAGGALFGLAAWAGLVYGEYLVGRQVVGALGESNRWAGLAVGVVGVEAVSLVPLLGGFVTFAVLLVGLGAGALVVADRWRDGDEPDEPPAPEPAPEAA
ncbi:MAG: polymer-forming cytoskeletal protein [Haloarculaceae archaeon]